MKIAESWLRANVFANRWSSAKMWWFRTMTDEGGGAIKSVPMQHACRGKLTWLIDCSRIRINFPINLARDFHSCTNQLLSGAWQLISSFGPLQLSQIDYSAVEALNKFELIKSNALSLGFGVGCGGRICDLLVRNRMPSQSIKIYSSVYRDFPSRLAPKTCLTVVAHRELIVQLLIKCKLSSHFTFYYDAFLQLFPRLRSLLAPCNAARNLVTALRN